MLGNAQTITKHPIVKTPEKLRRITYRRLLDPLNKLQDMNQQFC
jgi:hypothetical protein